MDGSSTGYWVEKCRKKTPGTEAKKKAGKGHGHDARKGTDDDGKDSNSIGVVSLN